MIHRHAINLNMQYGVFFKPPHPEVNLSPSLRRLQASLIAATHGLDNVLTSLQASGWRGDGCHSSELPGSLLSICHMPL